MHLSNSLRCIFNIYIFTVYKLYLNKKNLRCALSPNTMLLKIIHNKLEIQINTFSLLQKSFKLNSKSLWNHLFACLILEG